MVQPHHRAEREVVDQLDGDVAVARQQLLDFWRRLFEPVDLALLQGGRRGGGIGDDQPFDAVEMHLLGPGDQAGGALGDRHVARVAVEDHAAAAVEFGFHEDEGAGTGRVINLLERIGLGNPFGHDETGAADLAQRLEQHRERLLQAQHDAAIIGGRDLVEHRLELEAVGGALHPAADALGDVDGADGGAVVEEQAVAQGDGDSLAIVFHQMPGGHLGAGDEGLVDAVERVVDHVAVVAGDVGRGPDRVDRGEIGLRHRAQHAGGLGQGGGCQYPRPDRREEAAAPQGHGQALRRFQKVAKPFSMPVMSERYAVGCWYWPSGI